METCSSKKRRIVLFLDIDGVLLPFPDPGVVPRGRLFPNGTLDALSYIVERFQCCDGNVNNNNDSGSTADVGIVLSSTWRVQRKARDEILEDFKAHGRGPLSRMEDFYGITDPKMHTERQHEIYAWLVGAAANTKTDRTAAASSSSPSTNIHAWVALDDEDLLEGPANARLRSRFENRAILCDSKVGLTLEQAKHAVHLIEQQIAQLSSAFSASSATAVGSRKKTLAT
jgi:HAD domain in Swiss Army Knife RNA repair proteins